MKRRIIGTVLTVVSVSVLLLGFSLGAEQRALTEKLVRLHVVANSDSETDQAIKLEVRDAVLEETQRLMDGRQDPKEALRTHLPEIQATANACLKSLGSKDRAKVTMEKELFPTREYETFSLPAGTYTALRVTIGEGQGHNWWCVVFPSLCMTASADEFEHAAQAAGLTEGEIRLITEDSAGYELKFKSLEWLQAIKNVFSDGK